MPIEKKALLDAGYRVVVIVLLLANFWARSTFVTKDVYESDKEITRKTLGDIVLLIKTDEVRSERIADHESRIRTLEMKR